MADSKEKKRRARAERTAGRLLHVTITVTASPTLMKLLGGGPGDPSLSAGPEPDRYGGMGGHMPGPFPDPSTPEPPWKAAQKLEIARREAQQNRRTDAKDPD